MIENRLVQTIWNFCHTLRDDGVSYLDYLEQITYLLFLKIVDDTAAASSVPPEFRWGRLSELRGRELEATYMATLQDLAHRPGALGAIFHRAQNKIQDPAKLARLIHLIDSQRWPNLDADTKGAIYEGLLQKNAEDTKSGAGQYFTPRPIIQAIVACVRPNPERTIYDPACGTGGFFLAAHEWLKGEASWLDEIKHRKSSKPLNVAQQNYLAQDTFHGAEIVPSTRRLCLMNLYLRGIGSPTTEPLILGTDALVEPPPQLFDYIFANPPFGSRSSMTSALDYGHDDLTYHRPDFWAPSSNKQLNFVQHIAAAMAPGGSAAIVVPDNVLFSAGAGEKVRRRLLTDFNLHTILRLPTGIFYAQGVRANVLFLERPKVGEPALQDGVWVYDLRTRMRFTLRGHPMRLADLAGFIESYKPDSIRSREPSDRFRFFPVNELLARDRTSLDLNWPIPGSDNLEEALSAEELHQSVIDQLETALEAYRDGRAFLTRLAD